MWSLLQRSFEDLLVGSSTALIMLAMLSSSQLRAHPAKTAEACGTRPASATQDFAAQWRQIADEFYATHPVMHSAASSPMSLVSHRSGTVKADAPAAAPVIAELAPLPRVSLGGYAIAASLAAGVLTVLLYRSVWPAAAALPQRSLDCSHNLRIELPGEWVRVRPSFRAQLRPFVLLASQLWAAIAVWSILR